MRFMVCGWFRPRLWLGLRWSRSGRRRCSASPSRAAAGQRLQPPPPPRPVGPDQRVAVVDLGPELRHRLPAELERDASSERPDRLR